MRAVVFAIALLACLAACATEPPKPISGRTAYINAFVFDGMRFQSGAIVVEGGRIVNAAPSTAAGQIDLAGGHVVPPLCEAHNHNLGFEDENQERITQYLREGIFYVGILSNLPALTDPVRGTYNYPRSVDVIFPNGPLTASGGHPIRLREALLERGIYPGFTRETLPDQGYFVVDNEADLERKWPVIVGFRPDFIKIMLLWSEEFELRRDNPKYFGLKGLDPTLVPRIVERAHREGLRVFAHIESGHDFHVALASGVDVIAHLPGNDQPTRIDPADAKLAAERGVPVMTTTVLIERPNRRKDPALYKALRQGMITNLRILRDAGVRLAAGSDEPRGTSTAEIVYLRSLGVFTDAELLRMWSIDCAQTLFPGRRLGELTSGNEASFLVLGANPLEKFEATADIRLRVKEGIKLDVAPKPPG